ncbi:MAG TPA: gliding motility-associated C-terminal domain-containing protein, partial [Chitinophagaceae bacterium]|nr:gliding motility-associated C-terminal domain-containing protein [Chitinophagaceae bacterium]
SAMPILSQGHEYLLLISHFTRFNPSTKGYTLEFGGGTASITDPVIPSLKSAEPDCNRTKITIKLGKKIKCNSLAPDGSDFSLSPATANIIGATGIGCNSSFDTDSILLTLDAPLPAGNYFATAKNGIDNNTLLDNCDNQMPVGEKIDFVVTLPTPTPIDSLVPLTCAPDKLTLVFRKKIKCASIAPDGSDFIITGTYPVTITGAMGNCNTNGTTSTIDIKLSQPITQAGNFTITLKNGLDGDPIIDECGIPTPIGQGQSFVTKDTVNANFTFAISKGCKNDTVYFSHPGGNQINKWTWDLENGRTSNMQNPAYIYLTQGVKTVSLTVSNGFCNHTTSQNFTLEEKVKAAFTGPDILCPEDGAVFIDSSISATTWQWDFDNGQTSAVKSPLPQYYPPTNNEKDYTIELIVSDGMCFDTTYRNMKVVKSCYIAIPNAFTPDNNGLNDFLYPLNAYKADNLEFKVYNRYGQLVFQTNNWKIKWDGNIKGNPQPAGTYVWYLKYKERDTGKNVFLKGTTVLIR